MGKVINHLVLIVNAERMTAWRLALGHSPKNIRIHGDIEFDVKSSADLASALRDVKENLQGSGIKVDRIYWLADKNARQQLTDPRHLSELLNEASDWQVLSLNWLAGRFGRNNAELSTDFIEQELLPWLITADDAAEREQMKQALQREHVSEAERLQAERVVMEQENRTLQEQNAALRQVDKERLATYLPALFSRVFTIIGANDLALICGSVEPLNIPNPYPEPSTEALRVLQKQFRNLPIASQRVIVQLVQSLPHRQRLTVRPEMRELINELEG